MDFHGKCRGFVRRILIIFRKFLPFILRNFYNKGEDRTASQSPVSRTQSRQILTILVVAGVLFGAFLTISPPVTADSTDIESDDSTFDSVLAEHPPTSSDKKIAVYGDDPEDSVEQTSDGVDIVMSVGDYPDEVTPTETFTVPVTIENQGSETSEEIDLGVDSIDGLSVEEYGGSVGPLDPGEQASAEWVFRLDSENGGYADTVAIAGESPYPSEQIEVDASEEEPEEPFFTVNAVDSSIILDEGEEFDIAVEVENTGGQSDTQTVEIDTNGLGSATEEVTLDAGDSTTITKTFSTSSGDAGEYNGDINSDDDSTDFFVGVEEDESEPPEIVMSVGDYPNEVTPTETFTVPVTIENEGGETSEEIDLGVDSIDGLSVEEYGGSVGPLDPGEQASAEWVFRLDSENGGYAETVAIAGESPYPSEQIEVDASEEEPEEPFFTVNAVDSSVIIDEGEEFDITAEVENTGGQSDTQTVEINTNGLGSATEEVTLDAGDSTTITKTFSTSSGDAGEYNGDINSDDDSTDFFVGVEEAESEPPEIVMSVGDYPDEVTPTETFTVPVTVENEGGETSEEIDLGVDSIDGLSVVEYGGSVGPLDSGEQASAEWVFRLDSENGGYADTVAIAGESPYPSEQIEVDASEEEPEEPFFTVNAVDPSVILDEGEEFDIAVEVENTGGQSDTQTVEIDTNGLGTATEEVTLDAGDSTTITKTFTTSSGDAGEYNGDIESVDDSTGFFVGVEKKNLDRAPTISRSEPTSTSIEVSPGDTQEFEVEVSDPDEDLRTVEWYVNGSKEHTRNLGGGSPQTDSWSRTFDSSGEHSIEAVVTDSNGNTDSAVEWVVNVEKEVGGTITAVEGIPEQYTPDESYDTTVEVSNPTDIEQEYTVSIPAESGVEVTGSNEKQVTIPAGESKSITFSVKLYGTETDRTVQFELATANGGVIDTSSKRVERTDTVLSVQVVDSTDTPVEGATVSLLSETNSTQTNAEGRAQLTSLVPGEHLVEITPPGVTSGEQTVTVEVTSGERTETTVRIDRTGTISGTVVDETGNPLSNGLVTINGETAFINEDGTFSFETQFAAGKSYTVDVTQDGDSLYRQEIGVSPGSNDITLTVENDNDGGGGWQIIDNANKGAVLGEVGIQMGVPGSQTLEYHAGWLGLSMVPVADAPADIRDCVLAPNDDLATNGLDCGGAAASTIGSAGTVIGVLSSPSGAGVAVASGSFALDTAEDITDVVKVTISLVRNVPEKINQWAELIITRVEEGSISKVLNKIEDSSTKKTVRKSIDKIRLQKAGFSKDEALTLIEEGVSVEVATRLTSNGASADGVLRLVDNDVPLNKVDELTKTQYSGKWSPGKPGNRAENFNGHYSEHGDEFGEISREQYRRQATSLLEKREGVTIAYQKNGENMLVANPETGAVAVGNSAGEVQTYFKPDVGAREYVRNRVVEEGAVVIKESQS